MTGTYIEVRKIPSSVARTPPKKAIIAIDATCQFLLTYHFGIDIPAQNNASAGQHYLGDFRLH